MRRYFRRNEFVMNAPLDIASAYLQANCRMPPLENGSRYKLKYLEYSPRHSDYAVLGPHA